MLQEDVFLPMLTAWESLEFYTQLSLPVLLSTQDRHARMNTVLETMGLAHVKSTKARPTSRNFGRLASCKLAAEAYTCCC